MQAAINAAGGELPLDLPNPPTYRKVNPADSPVMILAMTSDTVPLSEVYNLADQVLGQRLSQIEGVSQVSIGGGAKSAVRVQVNPAALASMGMSMEDIRTVHFAGQRGFAQGQPDRNDRESFVIASNDQLYRGQGLPAADRRAAQRRARCQLGSIANVIDAQENDQQAGWCGSKRAVLLIIRKQAAANVIDIADQIRAHVAATCSAGCRRRCNCRSHQRPHADHPRVGQRRAVHPAASASRWSSW